MQDVASSRAKENRPGYPWYAMAAIPLLRLEVPGWGRLANSLHIIGAEADPRWAGAARRRVRGKIHGYEMDLDLRDWSERQTYFLGRYHELGAILLMEAGIRPGERIADIGANIGMLTLHAARLVGAGGLVESFEPNPTCADRIAAALSLNEIKHVRLHPIGLADQPDTLKLNILLNHTGMGTLAAIPERDRGMVTGTVEVPVRTGDSVLLSSDRPITFIKIDVEGFETRAIRGIRETLARWKPIVATEVLDEWLQRAGSSAQELRAVMTDLGYEPFGIMTHRRGLQHRLALQPVDFDNLGEITDVAWVPKEGELRARLLPSNG